MSKNLLIQEPPLQVLPSLAKLVGLNEAIVIQQLHYWLENKSVGVEIEGFRWVYNTYEKWQEDNFPFWSIPTIQRIFSGLEKDGLIISGQFEKSNYDRKKYYRIDYEKLNLRSYQVDTIVDPTLIRSLDESETTTETTKTPVSEKPKYGSQEWKNSMKKKLAEKDLGSAIQFGEEVTQELIDHSVLVKDATDSFEKDLKFNPLPWSSTKDWEKLSKFVVQEYQKDKLIFAKYKTWQQNDGKYLAMSNRKIKERPADFVACFPDFLAHSAMYETKKVESKPVDIDDNGAPISYG